MQLLLLLRGFVVLGVMLMHTAWFFSQNHTESWISVSEMLLDMLSLFAVPLFMFISGYLFISRHSHADVYSLGFCKKMFFSVLSPYLLFSLLYLAGAYFFSGERHTLREITLMLLTGSAAVHLGFFRALFGFYVFYPLIIRYFRRCRQRKTLTLYFGVVILLQIAWKTGNNLDVTAAPVAYLLLATTFLRYLAYFSFGMASYIYRRRLLWWIDTHQHFLAALLFLVVPMTGCCWLAKYYWHSYPVLEFICFPLNLFLYTILIAMLFRHAHTLAQQDNLSKRFVMYLGNYSFGIFLLHIGFMYVGVKMLQILNITPQKLIFYPLLFTIMLVLSVAVMEILIRLPLHNYLIGSTGNLHIFRRGERLQKDTGLMLKRKKR